MLTCRLYRSACRCYVGSMAVVYYGSRDQFSLFPSILLQYRVSKILGEKKKKWFQKGWKAEFHTKGGL